MHTRPVLVFHLRRRGGMVHGNGRVICGVFERLGRENEESDFPLGGDALDWIE